MNPDLNLLGEWAPLPPVVVDPDGLNETERAIVNDFVCTSSARHAARVAGIHIEQAERLLNLPKMRIAIARRTDQLRQQVQITIANVTREYAAVAFIDPRNYVDSRGDPIPLHELSDFAAAGLAGVDVTTVEVNGAITQRTYKYKLGNKADALNMLGKMLNLAPDKLELTGADGAPLIPIEATDNERARRVAFMLARALHAKEKGEMVDVPD